MKGIIVGRGKGLAVPLVDVSPKVVMLSAGDVFGRGFPVKSG